MASLESLTNPLERLGVLPTVMSWRTNPVSGSGVWQDDIQYYRNDVVFDPTSGGAYIWLGGSTAGAENKKVAVYGGFQPSNPLSGWLALGSDYVDPSRSSAPVAGAPAANAIPFTSGAVFIVPSGSVWQVSLQSTCTAAAPLAAVDVVSFTLTPTGTGAVPAVWDVLPRADATAVATRWGAGGVVVAGTGGVGGLETLTLTAAYAGAAQTLSATRVSLVRVNPSAL